MGIDSGLHQAAIKVPYEGMHLLSRQEIAAYGIDPRHYERTRWYPGRSDDKAAYVVNWIVRSDGTGHRASRIVVACSPTKRAAILYYRGMASDVREALVSPVLAIGERKISLSLTRNQNQHHDVDTGSVFALYAGFGQFDALE